MNGAVAHEFGHALGLKHTFTNKDDDEIIPSNNQLYNDIEREINNMDKWLKPPVEGKRYYFSKYTDQKTIITSINLYLNIWKKKDTSRTISQI